MSEVMTATKLTAVLMEPTKLTAEVMKATKLTAVLMEPTKLTAEVRFRFHLRDTNFDESWSQKYLILFFRIEFNLSQMNTFCQQCVVPHADGVEFEPVLDVLP